jgi:hypothetical protein
MSLLPTPTKPKNYLNNRDILREIHLSKSSYCGFTKPEYHRYDFIVDMPQADIADSLVSAISADSIQTAKETRATRLSIESGSKVSPDDIDITDLVFRIMTWDHVPVAPKQPRKTVKKRTAKDIIDFEDTSDEIFAELEDLATKAEIDDMVHVKVNFPPFQHFRLVNSTDFECIGKSHWLGPIDTGAFSKDHGKITNTLAKMYIMLCEKYAMKWNWRGYSYREEMCASAILQLTYVGLRFNEAKSANPFSYYTAAAANSFCRVLNTEKRSQNIRDDLLELNGLNSSYSRQNSNPHNYENE